MYSLNADAYGVLIRGNGSGIVVTIASRIYAISIHGSDGDGRLTDRSTLFAEVRIGAGNAVITNALERVRSAPLSQSGSYQSGAQRGHLACVRLQPVAFQPKQGRIVVAHA